jgi:RNase P subunit RPR2
MKKGLTKKQAEKEIEEFFKNIYKTKPGAKEIKKIKRLAMKYNIKLKENRKTFCKKCFSTRLKTKSVKDKIKRVKCSDCGYFSRWKIK